MRATISIAFDQSTSRAVLPTTISGGIRIEVGKRELTRIKSQDKLDNQAKCDYPNETWWFDSQGEALDAGRYEFKGDSAVGILSPLLENLIKIQEGEITRFEEIASEIDRGAYVLVFSYIDDTHELVRVAFQNYGERTGDAGDATVSASTGYAVGLDEFCREVARCVREFVEYADRSGFTRSEWDLIAGLQSSAEELERLADG